ncbi:hypothetical protein LTR62_008045 [Meristemomyces frigidus]|uniref:C2H2-type domain-containing protein n=1 Tax=Meristemomyces frigidus TaxID=1508187 RepID=A0AAN7TI62_9PEZI|nr:hypothetical protein LTR62_008045 [Meristemomyces frigidus]
MAAFTHFTTHKAIVEEEVGEMNGVRSEDKADNEMSDKWKALFGDDYEDDNVPATPDRHVPMPATQLNGGAYGSSLALPTGGKFVPRMTLALPTGGSAEARLPCISAVVDSIKATEAVPASSTQSPSKGRTPTKATATAPHPPPENWEKPTRTPVKPEGRFHYNCRFCDRRLTTLPILRSHMERIHQLFDPSKPVMSSCFHCGRQFSTVDGDWNHQPKLGVCSGKAKGKEHWIGEDHPDYPRIKQQLADTWGREFGCFQPDERYRRPNPAYKGQRPSITPAPHGSMSIAQGKKRKRATSVDQDDDTIIARAQPRKHARVETMPSQPASHQQHAVVAPSAHLPTHPTVQLPDWLFSPQQFEHYN